MTASIRLPAAALLGVLLCGPAEAGCQLTKVTEMPLVELGTHIAVMATLDNKVLPIIVDTGAATTVLKLSVVSAMKLKLDPSLKGRSVSVGIGQTVGEVHANAIPSVLGFGALVFHDRSTAVNDFNNGATPEAQSIGLLGDDILSNYDVEFDLPNKRLTFYTAADCFDTFAPWTGDYTTLPIRHDQTKVTIDVFLNNERTRAIIDTGADLTLVSKDASSLWYAPADEYQDIKGKVTTPLNGGSSASIKDYIFNHVGIGDETFDVDALAVVDVDLGVGSALIGLDFWRTHRFWISYPTGWMFMTDHPDKIDLAYPLAPAVPPPSSASTAATPPSTRLVAGADPALKR